MMPSEPLRPLPCRPVSQYKMPCGRQYKGCVGAVQGGCRMDTGEDALGVIEAAFPLQTGVALPFHLVCRLLFTPLSPRSNKVRPSPPHLYLLTLCWCAWEEQWQHHAACGVEYGENAGLPHAPPPAAGGEGGRGRVKAEEGGRS